MTTQSGSSHTLPNFLVIGAGKSGTTSLYYYLKQHPGIFMSPIKEVNYFAYDPQATLPLINIDKSAFPIKSMEAYQQLFAAGSGYSARGEASPMYLWHPAAAGNIHAAIPDARLIGILRNPVERAYSAYLMYTSQGLEKRSFRQAVADEIRAHRGGDWPLGRGAYIGLGFYARQLEKYFRLFGNGKIKIILQEDLQNDAQKILRDIYRFISVEDDFVPNSLTKHNASGLPKIRMLEYIFKPRKFVKRVRQLIPPKIHDPIYDILINIRNLNLVKPPMDIETRRLLMTIFHDDIMKTERLIARDLDHW